MAEILRYAPRCSVCGKRVATKLCDFPIGTLQYIGHPPRTFYSYNGFDVGMRRVITCDKPICDVCSVNIGEIDFCRTHKGVFDNG